MVDDSVARGMYSWETSAYIERDKTFRSVSTTATVRIRDKARRNYNFSCGWKGFVYYCLSRVVFHFGSFWGGGGVDVVSGT